ncbi:hypothetical protein [Nocardioides montaniterrae]
MATGPVEADPAKHVQADDNLALKYAESEANVQRLTAELQQARERIAALESRPPTTDETQLSLFEGGDYNGGGLTGDGSDPRVLSAVLWATAVVSGMVVLLALLNHNLFSIFGIFMLAVTIGLAYAAMRTKVEPIEVSVVRGLVYVKKGENTNRFDVRSPATVVREVGRPGDADWRLEFDRKGMEPYVINASMVPDPTDFMAQVRQWRADV